MSETLEGQNGGGPKPGPLTIGLWVAAVVVAAAALYVIVHLSIKPGAPAGPAAPAPSGAMASLSRAYAGSPEPLTPILDAGGKTVTLAAFKGKPIIVNMWATWCAPCRKEMPSLAKLQAAYGDRVRVVPVSMDKAEDREAARAFIAANAPLPFYQDEAREILFDVKPPAEGLPTTFLFDAQGREIARISADHDWNSPAAHAVVDGLLKGS